MVSYRLRKPAADYDVVILDSIDHLLLKPCDDIIEDLDLVYIKENFKHIYIVKNHRFFFFYDTNDEMDEFFSKEMFSKDKKIM